MNDLPPWLNTPALRELLDRLVDRLESAEKRGSRRVGSLALTERSWPALYKANRESEKEHLWAQLRTLAEWGWLNIKPEHAARQPGGYASAPRLTVVDDAALRRALGRETRRLTTAEQWRHAVDTGLQADPATKAAVAAYCIDIPDKTMAETVAQLNRLPELAGQPLLLREVSSRLFWGMSKILDRRQPLVAALLGMDDCPFAESPVQLQVYLPPGGYSTVLFIENLMSFEQATRSHAPGFQRQALVYASGFKGSAQRLRNPQSCSLYYASQGDLSPPQRQHFESWLFQGATTPCFFWGDLDWSGMRILSAMRSNFPELQAWQPGYRPMLNALLAGQGHAPEAADKQGQKPIAATGCLYADSTLLPALLDTGHFVDQEQLTLDNLGD